MEIGKNVGDNKLDYTTKEDGHKWKWLHSNAAVFIDGKVKFLDMSGDTYNNEITNPKHKRSTS